MFEDYYDILSSEEPPFYSEPCFWGCDDDCFDEDDDLYDDYEYDDW